MPTWLAAITALAAVTAVYVFCIRPMRSGGCAMRGARQDPELARQIADLREELRVLRAQDALASGLLVRNDPPRPGGDS
jgi:hypothetical protein